MKAKGTNKNTVKKLFYLRILLLSLIIAVFTITTISINAYTDTEIKVLEDQPLTIYMRNALGKLNKTIEMLSGSFNDSFFKFISVNYEIWNPYNTSLIMNNLTFQTSGGFTLDESISLNSSGVYRGHGCPSYACPSSSYFELKPGVNSFNNSSEEIVFNFQNQTNAINQLPKGVYYFNINFEGYNKTGTSLKKISYIYGNKQYQNEFNFSISYNKFNITSDGLSYQINTETLNENWGKILYSIEPIIETTHESNSYDMFIPVIVLIALEIPLALLFYYYKRYKKTS